MIESAEQVKCTQCESAFVPRPEGDPAPPGWCSECVSSAQTTFLEAGNGVITPMYPSRDDLWEDAGPHEAGKVYYRGHYNPYAGLIVMFFSCGGSAHSIESSPLDYWFNVKLEEGGKRPEKAAMMQIMVEKRGFSLRAGRLICAACVAAEDG